VASNSATGGGAVSLLIFIFPAIMLFFSIGAIVRARTWGSKAGDPVYQSKAKQWLSLGSVELIVGLVAITEFTILYINGRI